MKKDGLLYLVLAAAAYFFIFKNKAVAGIGQLRAVKVYFANGDSLITSMSAHLTDQDIKDYYRIGRYFNLGSGDKDNMQPVVKVEILK
jgi:hypothetical protein